LLKRRGFRQAAAFGIAAVASLAIPAGAFGVANHFEFSTPTSVSSGSQFQFTVTAKNPDNSTDTAFPGTVSFSSNDPGAILPGSTTLTNGTGTFNATLNTPGCRRITASSGSLISTSGQIAVNGCLVIDSQQGSLTDTDPRQTGRVAPSLPAGQCNTSETPTLQAGGDRAYDSYSHQNLTNGPICFTVDVAPNTAECAGKIFNVAYLGSFNPANPVANYLADSGESATVSGQWVSTSYTVGAGGSFVDVVHTTDALYFDCTQYFYALSANKPFAFSRPTTVGEARVGQVLGWTTGQWADNPAFTYQWRRCDAAGGGCLDIPGANAGTYAPVAADVGSTLRIRVFATDGLGSSSADSAQTAVVTTPVTDVTITGKRAAALKKCKKIKNKKKRAKCKKRAKRLPL
jgi:hypothetical protein